MVEHVRTKKCGRSLENLISPKIRRVSASAVLSSIRKGAFQALQRLHRNKATAVPDAAGKSTGAVALTAPKPAAAFRKAKIDQAETLIFSSGLVGARHNDNGRDDAASDSAPAPTTEEILEGLSVGRLRDALKKKENASKAQKEEKQKEKEAEKKAKLAEQKAIKAEKKTNGEAVSSSSSSDSSSSESADASKADGSQLSTENEGDAAGETVVGDEEKEILSKKAIPGCLKAALAARADVRNTLDEMDKHGRTPLPNMLRRLSVRINARLTCSMEEKCLEQLISYKLLLVKKGEFICENTAKWDHTVEGTNTCLARTETGSILFL